MEQDVVESTPKVLIVDDNPTNLIAFSAVLEPLGVDVRTVDGGEEALKACAAEDFAVILLDVRMPRLDGFETAERIREQPRTRGTPIVFTSAYDSTPGQLTKAYVAGATDYIPSPVNEHVLRLKVSAFVELWRRGERLKAACRRLEEINAALQKEIEACRGSEEALRRKALALQEAVHTLRAEIGAGVHFPTA